MRPRPSCRGRFTGAHAEEVGVNNGNGVYPEDLRYTKEHEWVRLSGEVGAIGITHYAQSELGDIVYVELPDKGAAVVAGETFGTVESVKAVSELYAPVSGEVVEVNEALGGGPEVLNKDPYGEGWLIRIRLANPAETESLMSMVQYRKFIEDEAN
jgi:glycine cleavage system H protein